MSFTDKWFTNTKRWNSFCLIFVQFLLLLLLLFKSNVKTFPFLNLQIYQPSRASPYRQASSQSNKRAKHVVGKGKNNNNNNNNNKTNKNHGTMNLVQASEVRRHQAGYCHDLTSHATEANRLRLKGTVSGGVWCGVG